MKTMDSLLATLHTQFAGTLEKVRAEATRMDDAAKAATGGKIEPISDCMVPSAIARCGNISSFGSTGLGYLKPAWATCAKLARDELTRARAALEAQHTANLPLLENNRHVVAQVKLIMGNLGIPESRSTYGYATQRARKMTTQTVTAGYIADLAAVCKTNDGYDACKRALDEFEKRIERYEAEERAKEAEVERTQARERAEREKLTLLGAMAHKYGSAADIHQLLEAMCAKDKYFGLGYWLERNRSNWHDGPEHASTGLSYFLVESAEDQAIYADIAQRIENWGGDGRTFRDAPYGFDYLFAKADAELVTDYQKLQAAGLIPQD